MAPAPAETGPGHRCSAGARQSSATSRGPLAKHGRERTQLPADLSANVAWLRERTPLPICIGFGISQPEHVRLLRTVADGLIVGSALVRQVAAAAVRPRAQVLHEIGDYAATLLAALNP